MHRDINIFFLLICTILIIFGLMAIIVNVESIDDQETLNLSRLLIYIPISLSLYGSFMVVCGEQKFRNRPERLPINHVVIASENRTPPNEVIDAYPLCIICFENIQSTLLNCGHANLCSPCAQLVKECPLCRQTVTKITENFYSKLEYCK